MDMQSSCVKPLRESENTKLDSMKTTALLISSKLDNKRQATASRIHLDKIKQESLSITDKLTARLFDDMDLKAVSSSILLVGTESSKTDRPVSVGARAQREAVRPKVTEFISRVLKRNTLQTIESSALSQGGQNSTSQTSYKYINLEEA